MDHHFPPNKVSRDSRPWPPAQPPEGIHDDFDSRIHSNYSTGTKKLPTCDLNTTRLKQRQHLGFQQTTRFTVFHEFWPSHEVLYHPWTRPLAQVLGLQISILISCTLPIRAVSGRHCSERMTSTYVKFPVPRILREPSVSQPNNSAQRVSNQLCLCSSHPSCAALPRNHSFQQSCPLAGLRRCGRNAPASVQRWSYPFRDCQWWWYLNTLEDHCACRSAPQRQPFDGPAGRWTATCLEPGHLSASSPSSPKSAKARDQ